MLVLLIQDILSLVQIANSTLGREMKSQIHSLVLLLLVAAGEISCSGFFSGSVSLI